MSTKAIDTIIVTTMAELEKQKCKPCELGTVPMAEAQIRTNLSKVAGWELATNKIQRKFAFRNFMENIRFVNQIAKVAEDEGHHPDLLIQYNKLQVTLCTHSAHGVTENDFILAAKINELWNHKE